MMKNRLIRFLIVSMACVALFACKKEKPSDVFDVGEKSDPLAMETELRILALNGRIESGKNNPALDWVTPFESATGCMVKATQVENGLVLGSSLDSKAFDLVISGVDVPVEPVRSIDTARLRSFRELDKRFLPTSDAGKIGYLPFQWQLLKPVEPATEFLTEVESIRVLANAKNINCAYAWMEWSLSPKVQADIAASLGTIPVVPAACIGNETLGDDACSQRMSEAIVPTPAEVPADAKTP